MLTIKEEYLAEFFRISNEVFAEWDNYQGKGKVPRREIVGIAYEFFESLKGYVKNFAYKKQFSEIDALRNDQRLQWWETALNNSKVPQDRKNSCLSHLENFYYYCRQLLVDTPYNPNRTQSTWLPSFTRHTPLIRASRGDQDVQYLDSLLKFFDTQEEDSPHTVNIVLAPEKQKAPVGKPCLFKQLPALPAPTALRIRAPGEPPVLQTLPPLSLVALSARKRKAEEADDLLSQLNEINCPTTAPSLGSARKVHRK